MKLGACHVETPFIEVGQLSTALYFSYFVKIVPVSIDGKVLQLKWNKDYNLY